MSETIDLRIVDRGPDVYTAKLYVGGREVGHAQASTVRRSDIEEGNCAEDVQQLRERLGRATPAFVLWRTGIQEGWRGKGHGVAMYEALLQALQEAAGRPVILFPEECLEDGSTTFEAERVWRSLRRRWMSEGSAVASVRLAAQEVE